MERDSENRWGIDLPSHGMARHCRVLIIALLALALLGGCGQQTPEPTSRPTPMPTATAETTPADLVTVVRSNPDLSELAAALERGDLIDKLSTAGPYTLFAPTDQAFEDLPDSTRQDPDLLVDILLYHVVEGALTIADLAEAATVTTLLGDTLAVGEAANLRIADATIATPDLAAGNGIIHIIDTLLIPPTLGQE